MDSGALPKSSKHAPNASALLAELHDAFPNEKVTVDELIDRLEGRAIGLLLVAPGVQMMLGGRKLWLPRRVRAWSFSREGLQRAIQVANPYLKRIEKLIRPRLSFLTQAPFSFLFGFQVLVMAFVLVLPIPFGNWPPAMTLAMMALALLQRDGVLMLLSVPAAALSVGIAYAGVRIGWAALVELGQILAGFFTYFAGG